VIAIGINRYAQREFNLTYAVPDAKASGAGLEFSLPLTEYSLVRQTKLLVKTPPTPILFARSTSCRAGGIRAGRTHPKRLPVFTLPNRRMRCFSTWWATDSRSSPGFPPAADRGYSDLRAELRNAIPLWERHSISHRDFELMLEGIEAQNIAFVLDERQSGHAMASTEEQRGPMNTTGVAQLA
jgi:hypothetical protein